MKTRNTDLTRSVIRTAVALAPWAWLTAIAMPMAFAQDLDPQLIGQWPPSAGSVESVLVREGYAYVALGDAGLAILDVLNAARPARIGGCETAVDARHLALSGQYACLAGGAVLQLVDVSNPTDPRVVGTFNNLGGTATSVAVSSSHAYVSIGNSPQRGLRVLDIDNPTNPHMVGSVPMDGSASDVEVSGGIAYVTAEGRGSGRLQVIDVSTPEAPRILSSLPASAVWPTDVARMALAGSICCVVRDHGGGRHFPSLELIDVSDPRAPQRISSYPLPHSGSDGAARYDVTTAGNRAFCFGNGLMDVIDIRDPSNPRRVGRFKKAQQDGGSTAVSGHYAYLANGGEGLQVIGLRPANPQRIATTGGDWIRGVEVQGGLAYLAPWDKPDLLVMDVSDVRSPRTVGEYDNTDQRAGRIEDIAVSGSHAFAAIELDSAGGLLQVLDISRPEKPQWVGSHEFAQGAVSKVVLAPPYAYVLAESVWGQSGVLGGGLFVIDVSDSLHPNQVGAYPSRGPRDVAISGRYAFMTAWRYENTTAGQGGLHVIDVGEARDPRVVAVFEEGKTFSTVDISGGLAYVVDEAGNLSILDIAQPGQPHKVGEVSLGEWTFAHDIMVSGDYAYVLGDVLAVVDVGNPANPRRVGGNTGVEGYDIAHSGGHLFVAGGTFQILNAFIEHRLGPARVEADGKIRLSLKGPRGQRVRVQRSGNLIDWEEWQAVTLGESGSELLGNTREAPYRFYRSVIE